MTTIDPSCLYYYIGPTVCDHNWPKLFTLLYRSYSTWIQLTKAVYIIITVLQYVATIDPSCLHYYIGPTVRGHNWPKLFTLLYRSYSTWPQLTQAVYIIILVLQYVATIDPGCLYYYIGPTVRGHNWPKLITLSYRSYSTWQQLTQAVYNIISVLQYVITIDPSCLL